MSQAVDEAIQVAGQFAGDGGTFPRDLIVAGGIISLITTALGAVEYSTGIVRGSVRFAKGAYRDYQASATLRQVERIVNRAIRDDPIGWGRIFPEDRPLSFKLTDIAYPRFESGVVLMPRSYAPITIHDGVAEFVRCCAVRPLKRLLDESHRFALNGSALRSMVEPRLNGVAAVPITPVPRNVKVALVAAVEQTHRNGLQRAFLLEAGDWNLPLRDNYDSALVTGVRECFEATLRQLAAGYDPTRKRRDGRREFDVSCVRLRSYCNSHPQDIKLQNVVDEVDRRIQEGHKVYVMYPSLLESDPLHERLVDTRLWDRHYRDSWYENGTSRIRKGRLSFVPDRVAVTPT